MLKLVVLASLMPAHGATILGGDYAGADLVPADGDVLEGTFTNVGVFHVQAGTVAIVQDGVHLVIEAESILIEGTLDGDAAGHVGGDSDHPRGSGPEGGGAPRGEAPGVLGNWSGAGGGGYGGRGGRGGVGSGRHRHGWPGGDAYGSHNDASSAPLGSGGGYNIGGGHAFFTYHGGDGGGSITLHADTIDIASTGVVTVAGEPADDISGQYYCYFSCTAGPGGGSGGSLVLDATVSVVVDGTLLATGGDGGEADTYYEFGVVGGGGGGAGGRIKVFGPMIGGIDPNAAQGGAGGESQNCTHPTLCPPGAFDPRRGDAGDGGTIYVDDWVAGPPTATATGACGSITFTVSDGTPLGLVQVLRGETTGTDILTGGVCAGLATGLSVVTPLEFFQVDDTGSVDVSGIRRDGPAPACGDVVQVVDLWSCTTSAVVTLP